MAKLFLESTDTTYKVSTANTKVYGATGDQVVTVDAAATGVTFDANVEGVSFSGATSDFTYKQLGLTDLGVYKAGALFALCEAPLFYEQYPLLQRDLEFYL